MIPACWPVQFPHCACRRERRARERERAAPPPRRPRTAVSATVVTAVTVAPRRHASPVAAASGRDAFVFVQRSHLAHPAEELFRSSSPARRRGGGRRRCHPLHGSPVRTADRPLQTRPAPARRGAGQPGGVRTLAAAAFVFVVTVDGHETDRLPPRASSWGLSTAGVHTLLACLGSPCCRRPEPAARETNAGE